MKKLFLILSVAMLSLGTVNVFAQDAAAPETEQVVEQEIVETTVEAGLEGESLHHVLMQKFLEIGRAHV